MEEQKTRKKRGPHSEETKSKMKAAWARRKCAAIVSKPEDFGSQSPSDDVQDEDNLGNK